MQENSVSYVKNLFFIQKIKQLPFVKKIVLFGSRAQGTNRSRSDIDIAVFGDDFDTYQWAAIMDILDEADTLLEIDCVNFNQAPLELQKEILKDGIEL